jgi:hypothetical protein
MQQGASDTVQFKDLSITVVLLHNLLLVTLLTLTILKWLLHCWQVCGPLFYNILEVNQSTAFITHSVSLCKCWTFSLYMMLFINPHKKVSSGTRATDLSGQLNGFSTDLKIFHLRKHTYHCSYMWKCHLVEMLISGGFCQEKNSKSCPGIHFWSHLTEEKGTNGTTVISPCQTCIFSVSQSRYSTRRGFLRFPCLAAVPTDFAAQAEDCHIQVPL